VPIAYTQGFNRHAKIAYGPPLTLGATSAGEYFDLELAQPCAWPAIAAMNDVLPEGIRIVGGRAFVKSADSLMAAITRADYRVGLTAYLLDRLARGESVHLVRQELERSLSTFVSGDTWLVAKPSHGKSPRMVNVRPSVVSIAPADWDGSPGVRLTSRLQASGHVRPDLLFRSFLPSFEFDSRLLRVHREAMWVELGDTLCTPIEAIEESAFWRAVPVDATPETPSDPALEVNAPRDHH
jgi:radical SAM-linked protein